MQLDAKSLCTHIVTRDNCPSSSNSSTASLHWGFCNQWASWSSSFGWTEELCNQHLPQVSVLVMYLDMCIDWLVTYWEPCIERRDCHYIANPIRYWGKGSTVGWYYVLGFLLLVTTCFDNSGFSGVVTLNSLDRVLPWWFSLFVNKSLVSNLFLLHLT